MQDINDWNPSSAGPGRVTNELMRPKLERLVLIAEDEPDVARLIAFHLARHGFRTAIVLDGPSALEAFQKHQPDLVILDVMLPGCDGLEVCSRIKSAADSRNVPVMLVTALSTSGDKLRGFGSGADDYLTKPFVMSELIVRIYALLRRHGLAVPEPAVPESAELVTES